MGINVYNLDITIEINGMKIHCRRCLKQWAFGMILSGCIWNLLNGGLSV